MTEKKLRRIRLPVIPEPSPQERAILVPTPDFPAEEMFIKSPDAELQMYCGKCGRVLMEVDSVATVQGAVLKCPTCGAFNDTLMHP